MAPQVEVRTQTADQLGAVAIKNLKQYRKETREVMQRFEGASDLSDDEIVTYKHLTLSLVLSNALSDFIRNSGVLPRGWDTVSLGTDFDPRKTPILKKNAEGELWVEYFNCDRPKEALVMIAGEAAKFIPEVGRVVPRRPPKKQERSSPDQDSVAPVQSEIMDLIRKRMAQKATKA